jgi:hypothetical protein
VLTLISEFLFAAAWLAFIVGAVGVLVFFGYALVDLIGERIFGESPLDRRMR